MKYKFNGIKSLFEQFSLFSIFPSIEEHTHDSFLYDKPTFEHEWIIDDEGWKQIKPIKETSKNRK